MSFHLPIKLKPTQNTLEGIINLVLKVNDNIREALQFFVGKPQLDSQILSGTVLAAGLNTVPHKLGRIISGWQIVKQNGPSIFYDNIASQPSDIFLYLWSSNPVTVDLLVF